MGFYEENEVLAVNKHECPYERQELMYLPNGKLSKYGIAEYGGYWHISEEEAMEYFEEFLPPIKENYAEEYCCH